MRSCIHQFMKHSITPVWQYQNDDHVSNAMPSCPNLIKAGRRSSQRAGEMRALSSLVRYQSDSSEPLRSNSCLGGRQISISKLLCFIHTPQNKVGLCLVGRRAIVSSVFPHFGEEGPLQVSCSDGRMIWRSSQMEKARLAVIF